MLQYKESIILKVVFITYYPHKGTDLKGREKTFFVRFFYVTRILIYNRPHQRLSGSALKTGRQEVLGLGCACQNSRPEFSVVFSETLENMGSLKKTPTDGNPL